MADFFPTVMAQRACRRFDLDSDVSDDDIESMISAAVHAPSAENTQPWVFIVVRDEQTRADLAAWWTETWNAGGAQYARQVASEAMYTDLEIAVGPTGFAAAPAVVVVSVDTERVLDVFAQSSIYPAVQNLLLAANALGYGSCLTTGLTLFGVQRVRERLALPETITPMAAVYIGKPAVALKSPKRRPAREVTYRESFGASW
ncbi:nitroreductase family protein [Mycolicibacterium boenickei]|nr:nitroreductase family protein [Mycolicibacterium boenickei]